MLSRLTHAVESIADSKNAAKLEEQRNEMFSLALQAANFMAGISDVIRNTLDDPNLDSFNKAKVFRHLETTALAKSKEFTPKSFTED